jgi:hypothetical protein
MARPGPEHPTQARLGRVRLGLVLLAAAVVLPVAALLFPLVGLPSAASNLAVSLLVAGAPEILCLVAVALLGRAGFDALGGRTVPRSAASVREEKVRYYGALLYCGLNTLPIALYAYVPAVMPGGTAKLVILAVTDLGFVLSVLLAGGQFWEKFRRLFVFEPDWPAGS